MFVFTYIFKNQSESNNNSNLQYIKKLITFILPLYFNKKPRNKVHIFPEIKNIFLYTLF